MTKPKRLAFQGGFLIDGRGNPPLEDAVVVIEGQKLIHVADRETSPRLSDADVIDISGKTIMPGMIDSHVHLCLKGIVNGRGVVPQSYVLRSPHMTIIDAVVNARTIVMSGITTVRTAGEIDNVDISVRNAINQGKIVGPRIVASGKALGRTGSHGHILPSWLATVGDVCEICAIVDGPEAIRKAIRTQLHAGTDYIKLFQTGGATDPPAKFARQEFSPEELTLIHEEARRFRVDTGTHAHNKEGILAAIQAGTRSIEHGSSFDRECARLAREQGVFYSPTLAVYESMLELGVEGGLEAFMVEIAKGVTRTHHKNVKEAAAQGVKIVTGTDGGTFINHGVCARELKLLVECGLPELEAIGCATKNGAELLRLDTQLGTLEAGKWADLLVVEGNPLQDITVLQDASRMHWILKGGQVIQAPPNVLRKDL